MAWSIILQSLAIVFITIAIAVAISRFVEKLSSDKTGGDL